MLLGGESEEPFEPPPVEPDDDLPVYRDDRGGHFPGEFNDFLAGCRIFRKVFIRIGDLVGRKKLLRRVARPSRGGGVNSNLS